LPDYPLIKIRIGGKDGWIIETDILIKRDCKLQESFNEEYDEWQHPKFTLRCLNEKEGCPSIWLPSSRVARSLRQYWIYRLANRGYR
jgi:hypothetical protein